MRHLGYRAAAIGTGLLIVFAPSPSRHPVSDEASRTKGPLIGRALAPTIDVADVREQEASRTTRQPVRAVWAVGVLVLALAGLRRRILRLVDPSQRRRLHVAAKTCGCRAPPALA
jgi:hypothetical protein